MADDAASTVDDSTPSIQRRLGVLRDIPGSPRWVVLSGSRAVFYSVVRSDYVRPALWSTVSAQTCEAGKVSMWLLSSPGRRFCTPCSSAPSTHLTMRTSPGHQTPL